MQITNTTALSTCKLSRMFLAATAQWSAPRLKVAVRYSRGAAYSGTFAFNPARIYINIGKKNRYPVKVDTSIAKARTLGRSWWKPLFSIYPADAYQLALFVFLHEFYHYLIHRARRNNRRKESMCDRFAVAELVDRYRLRVYDCRGQPVDREQWHFQNLTKFVLTTTTAPVRPAARRPRKTPTARRLGKPATGLVSNLNGLQPSCLLKPAPTTFERALPGKNRRWPAGNKKHSRGSSYRPCRRLLVQPPCPGEVRK